LRKTKSIPPTIFRAQDRNGVVDAIDLQIHLYPSASHPTVLSAVMDLCAGLGFETMALDLPLVKAGSRRDSSVRHHLHIGKTVELASLCAQAEKGNYFIAEENEAALAGAVRDLACSFLKRKATRGRPQPLRRDKTRHGFDLLNPFSIQGFYAKNSRLPLPNLLLYKIVLFGAMDLETAVAAANFAARLGLETTHLPLPLVFPLDERPGAAHSFLYIGTKKDWAEIKPGQAAAVRALEWEAGIFLVPSPKKIPDILICGEGNRLAQALDRLTFLPMNSSGVKDPSFRTVKLFQKRLEQHLFAKSSPAKSRSPRPIARTLLIADERREILELLKQQLKRWQSGPLIIDVRAFIARPEKTRRAFETDIQRLLRRMGVREQEMSVSVLNAYKPGLSWIREVVAKRLAKANVDRLEIAFKTFDQNGLEEKTRWLQELHPIDELLSAALAVSKEQIIFKMDARLKSIYRARAWCAGRLCLEEHFTPCWTKQLYLDEFPRAGYVHPCTGWLRIHMNGIEALSRRVPTGPERIWRYFQKEWLPLVAKEAHGILARQPLLRHDTLFEELRFDAYFDYPPESLALDEERLSPLEALHEDLYFVTLDFLRRWARKKGRPGLSAGRVLPVIHPAARNEKERMTFTLRHRPAAPLRDSEHQDGGRLSIDGILFRGSRMGVSLVVEGSKSKNSRDLAQKMKSFASSGDPLFRLDPVSIGRRAGRAVIRVCAFQTTPGQADPLPQKPPKRPLTIPTSKAIGYAENLKILDSLAGLPGVDLVEEGCSTGGLPVFSLAITYPCPSAFVSHAKRVAFKPALFINCRHHANEISSTNAGLQMARLLAVSPAYRKLLKKTNIVISPMENVDGVVILEEMLKWMPSDKLHAGRYNKAGQEYYAEYFNPATPFGEARVKPAIWHRWLPDICTDNHGFPSHEWEQPFSGYAPWQFRGWWLPRSLFFVYLPFLEEKTGSPRRAFSEYVKKQLTQAFRNHQNFKRWNQTFSKRYWKYKGNWLGERQKSQTDIQCFPLAKRFQQTNFAYRFPEVTTMDLITEAADETTGGALLKTCIAAHLQCNLALIKLLNSNALCVKKIQQTRNTEIHFLWSRQRAGIKKDVYP
jgi:hypothetical protein